MFWKSGGTTETKRRSRLSRTVGTDGWELPGHTDVTGSRAFAPRLEFKFASSSSHTLSARFHNPSIS